MIRYGVWVNRCDGTGILIDVGGLDQLNSSLHKEVKYLENRKISIFSTNDINLAHEYCDIMTHKYGKHLRCHYTVQELDDNWLIHFLKE